MKWDVSKTQGDLSTLDKSGSAGERSFGGWNIDSKWDVSKTQEDLSTLDQSGSAGEESFGIQKVEHIFKLKDT